MLMAGNIRRDSNIFLSKEIDLSSDQGLSPEEWMKHVIIFGALTAKIAGDVWEIVVLPRLKQVFHEDCVKEKH